MPTNYHQRCHVRFSNKQKYSFQVQQANTAVGGMLLANMERTGKRIFLNHLLVEKIESQKFMLSFTAEFPFIAYYVINTTQTDPTNFYSGIRSSSLSKFEPKKLR